MLRETSFVLMRESVSRSFENKKLWNGVKGHRNEELTPFHQHLSYVKAQPLLSKSKIHIM